MISKAKYLAATWQCGKYSYGGVSCRAAFTKGMQASRYIMTGHSHMGLSTIIEEEFMKDSMQLNQMRSLLSACSWNNAQTCAAISMFQHNQWHHE